MPLNLQKNFTGYRAAEEGTYLRDGFLAASGRISAPSGSRIEFDAPFKITTETDLVRLLSNTPLQVELDFMKIKGHTPKNTPIEHMQEFYKDFDEMADDFYDG